LTGQARKWLICSPVYAAVRPLFLGLRQYQDLRRWNKDGQQAPPPHLVKSETVLQYGRRYGLRCLVETGTYLGDMVAVAHRQFNAVYSIELDEELFRAAVRRFRSCKNVFLKNGDSAAVLQRLVGSIDTPCLFWLDAHYSGGVTARGLTDTPILSELRAVLSRDVEGDVLLIDDARLFGGDPNYPRLDELE